MITLALSSPITGEGSAVETAGRNLANALPAQRLHATWHKLVSLRLPVPSYAALAVTPRKNILAAS
jgi:hypothetical protein